MDVKLVTRTLDLFEAFAAEQKALSLTQLARLLSIPPSSCFAMVKTLVNRGYLYEIRRRGGYYPTRRLDTVARGICAVDPLVDMLHPYVVELRDLSGETVVLGKLSGACVIYLDVAESAKPIRYSAHVGELRPFHANSIGKALYAALPAEMSAALAEATRFEKLTQTTVGSPQALDKQVARMRRQGAFANFGESAPELSAIAVALRISGELFGLSVVGPTERIKRDQAMHIESLHAMQARMQSLDAEFQDNPIAGAHPA